MYCFNCLIIIIVLLSTGTYDIFISFANEDIPGAPLKVPVVAEEPMLEVGKEAELNMAPDDVNVPRDLPNISGVLSSPHEEDKPVDLKEGPSKSLTANFTPVEAGKNDLHLKKRGKDLPGSPVPLLVRDKPEVGKPCKIPFDMPDVDRMKDAKRLKGTLVRPNGKREAIDVDVARDGTISVTFTPEEPGKHIINIKKGKKHVEDSPYVIMVPGEEEVAPSAIVGSPCDVNLDLPDVKLPDDLKDLTATVERPNGEEEPCAVSANPDNTLAISFTPHEPGLHKLHVKKRRRPVKGSPFHVMVEEAPKAVKNPTVGSPCDVNLSLPDVSLPDDLPHLTSELERPTGEKEPIDLKLNPDNTLSISFIPTEPGLHLIHIKKRRRPIKDSPIKVMVDEAPGEKPPTVGNPCDVNLELPDLILPDDLPELSAVLERPSLKREKVPVKANPDNTLAVSFTPTEPGLHQIHIKKSKKPVKGSPFKIMVEESVPAEKQPTVGNPCDINMELPSLKLPDDLKKLKATLTRPNGKKEPLELSSNPDNTLGMHFVPEQPGKHIIDILKDRRPVEGTPIEIMVVEEDEPKKEPRVGDECALDLDIPGLDLPDDLSRLAATLKRPSKTREEPIDIEVTPQNTLSVKFVPKETGEHLISIKKDRRHVQGSPFTIDVVGEPVSEDIVPMTENTAESEPDFPDFPDFPEDMAPKPSVGSPHDANLKVPGINIPEDLPYLSAVLARPSGEREPLDVSEGPNQTLAVSFTPKESGEHLLHIKKNRREVSIFPNTFCEGLVTLCPILLVKISCRVS